jgi:hypothetical protein
MSGPFAKLFETPHGQLLAYLDETDEGDPAITVIGADVNGVRPSAKMSGWPEGEDGQRAAFDKLTQQMAEEQAAAFHHMVAQLAKPSAA